jgi:hypothetical protein
MSQTAPLHTGLQTSERDGRVDRLFHRWLQSLRKNSLQFSSVDVDTGSTPASSGTFTITDPEINEASRLLVIAAPDDENGLEPIVVAAVTCSAGEAVVEWESDAGLGFDGVGMFSLGAVTGTRTFFYGVSG